MAYTQETLDKFELLTLYRALWESQFDPRSTQRTLPGSPLVTALIDRVSVVLSVEGLGQLDRAPISVECRAWDTSLLRACEAETWAELDHLTKVRCAQAVLAPARAPAPEVERFIGLVDDQLNHHVAHGRHPTGEATRPAQALADDEAPSSARPVQATNDPVSGPPRVADAARWLAAVLLAPEPPTELQVHDGHPALRG